MAFQSQSTGDLGVTHDLGVALRSAQDGRLGEAGGMSDDPVVEPLYEEMVGAPVVEDEDLEEGIKLRAHDLFLRLQGTFSVPAYITLEEVRDATGFDGHRTADAMAISLYRSRGKSIYGFEMKVSRNDWLKELKQPEKAESIIRYCNYWALVVPDKSIVKDGELPESWGMYVAQKNRLKCVVPCPKLDPIPMSLTMLTALIYAVSNRQSKLDAAAMRAEWDRGYKSCKDSFHRNDYEEYYRELKEKVEAYEKASGLSIQHGWQKPDKVGGIVKLLLDGNAGLKKLLQTANYNLRQTDDLKVELQKQIEVINSAMAGQPEPEIDEDEA